MSRDYPGLDLIRLFAALAVAAYHLCYWWWLPGQLDRPDFVAAGWTQGVVAAGWIGVPIFFVLAGFVIAFTADGRSPGQFLRNRALRLYPIAWLCAATTALVAGATPLALVSSALLLPTGQWVSGVYWTLPVEIAFYLLVALSLRLRWDLSRLTTVLAVVGGGYWLARTADGLVGKPIRPFFELVEGSRWGNLTLLTYGCFFAIGMLLWAFAARRANRLHLPLLALCILAGLLQLVSSSHSINAVNGQAFSPAWPILIWTAALLLIIGSIRWNERLTAALGDRRATLRTAGLLTYPLYLVHSEVGRNLALALGGALPPVAATVVGLALTVAIAWCALRIEPYPKTVLARLLDAAGLGSRPLAAPSPR